MNTNNNRPQNNNNNNRRRGRNNNNNNNNRQQQNNRSGFDYNNSIDNRARGNAAQMLEKYKKMAQDAQFNDDRVNAEYHLQFADHYFRVLADFRGRQEARNEQQGERRPREDVRDEGRDDWQNEDRSQGYYDQSSNENAEAETTDDNGENNVGSNDREERPQRDDRPQRNANNEDRRPRRNDRSDRPERAANDRPNNERPANDRNANRAPRRHHSEEEADAPAGLDLAVLPPSIAIAPDFGDTDAEAKPARKPRARKPKSANDEDVATAAE